MYHDQGHIPVKALAFDRAVNCTWAPDRPHQWITGTALDIAWQGKASAKSLEEAVILASRMQLGSAGAHFSGQSTLLIVFF